MCVHDGANQKGVQLQYEMFFKYILNLLSDLTFTLNCEMLKSELRDVKSELRDVKSELQDVNLNYDI